MTENNMNKYFKTFAMAVAVAGCSTSCSNNDNIVPDTPDTPTTGYRLTFEGGADIETATRASWDDPNGSGNLIF